MSRDRWEEVLCEDNGYQLIVERTEFSSDEKDIIEVEIVEDKEESLLEILKRFMRSYLDEKDKMGVEEWLRYKLKSELPDRDIDEIDRDVKELISGVKMGEEMYNEVERKRALGITPADIIGKEIAKNTVGESVESVKSELRGVSEDLERENIDAIYNLAKLGSYNKLERYFSNIDDMITKGNEKMIDTITTKTGEISKNPHLDGFIFEQHHENSFNLDLAVKDIEGIRGEALVPDGKAYGKNSVDLVVKIKKDGTEKIVQKYQAKASENPEKLFKKGGYKFQRKLYSEGNESVGNTKIEYGGGESKPISKKEVKEIQKDVQNGKIESSQQSFKNNVDIKAVSKQIGKQVMVSGTVAMATSMGLNAGIKMIKGEKVDMGEITLEGLKVGANAGISTAIAGGLKVAVEKEVIKGIGAKLLKSSGVIGTIAFSAVSIVSILASIGGGERSLKDGIKDINSVFCSTYCGLQGMGIATGIATGVMATVGTVLAPVVVAVAGTIGFFAGSTVGSAISKGVSAVVESTVEVVKDVVSGGINMVKEVASGIWEGTKSLVSSVASGIGSVVSSIGSAIGSFFGW